MSSQTSENVRRLVSRDLRPVRPLGSPFRRLLPLIPLAVAVAALSPWLGARADIGTLGPMGGLGLSALEWSAGLGLLAVALRQAVPGYGLSARLTIALIVCVCAVIVLIPVVTNLIEPTVVPPGVAFRYWYECVIGPSVLALPMLAATLGLTMRAFPTTPGRVGMLAGAAAGLFSEAGWRLACSVSAPGHVLESHGLAIGLMAIVGASAATIVDRLRWRNVLAGRNDSTNR